MSQTDERGTHAVVGHHAGWGLIRPQRPIEPYQLTPGSIDTMQVRVREKIDIHGVGTDVVEMAGIFTVRRDHPCGVGESGQVEWGQSCVKTEFRGLELVGQSEVFGTVRVHLNPEQASHGEVGPAEEGSLAASCVAHCYPAVELPQLGMRLNTGDQPVNLASKVVQVPPVGDVARSENSAPLIDDAGNVVGEIVSSDIEVGEVLAAFPLGSTGGDEHGHQHHTRDSHPDPSGPGFYAEPPLGGPSQETPSSHGGPASSTSQVLGAVLSRLEDELRELARLVRQLDTGRA